MFFCAAVPISTCIAADDVTPSIELNSKAMRFSFSGLSVLGAGAFNGGFGGKYFIIELIGFTGKFAIFNGKSKHSRKSSCGSYWD